MTLRQEASYGQASDPGFAQYNRIELLVNFAEKFVGRVDVGRDVGRWGHEKFLTGQFKLFSSVLAAMQAAY